MMVFRNLSVAGHSKVKHVDGSVNNGKCKVRNTDSATAVCSTVTASDTCSSDSSEDSKLKSHENVIVRLEAKTANLEAEDV